MYLWYLLVVALLNPDAHVFLFLVTQAPWNPPEERKAYELPAEIDYECAYMEGQAFGGSMMGFDGSAQDMNGNTMALGMQGQDIKQMMINGGVWPTMDGEDATSAGYQHGGGYHGAAYDYGSQAAYSQYGAMPGNYGVSGAAAAKMVRCAPERPLPRNCVLLSAFSLTNSSGCVVMIFSPRMSRRQTGCSSRAQHMVVPGTGPSTTRTTCRTMLQPGTCLRPLRGQLATGA